MLPIDGRPYDSDGRTEPEDRAVPEDGRCGIGVNLCQLPRLLFPLSRLGDEFTVLPDLGADRQSELPRESGRELFIGVLERDGAPLFGPDCPKRRNPLSAGLPPLLLPDIDPPCWRFVFWICDWPRLNDRDGVELFPLAEKKCWFRDTLRMVDGAAGRPLA